MAKLRERFKGMRLFLSDVVAEMKKTSWPGREELLSSTAVVIVSVVMLSAFVGLCDKVLVELLRLIIPSG
jgi:preprotein translocase subunit SecE